MMPSVNYLAVIVAGLIPMILGALWYGPLFGKAWLSSLGKTEEEMRPANMGVTYGLALLAAMLISMGLKMIIELVHKDVNSAGELIFGSFHTFGHGALHGGLLGATLIAPVLLSFSLFHKMSAKTIVLNLLFWTVCFALMGGILDAWV